MYQVKPGVAGILSTSTPARWNIYATGGELRDKDEQKSLKVITLQGFLVIPSPDMWRVTWNPSNYEMKMIFRTRPLKLTRSTCSAAKWRCSSWPDILDQAASKAVPMNMSSTQTVAAYSCWSAPYKSFFWHHRTCEGSGLKESFSRPTDPTRDGPIWKMPGVAIDVPATSKVTSLHHQNVPSDMPKATQLERIYVLNNTTLGLMLTKCWVHFNICSF